MAKKKSIPEELEPYEEDIVMTDYCEELASSYLDYAVSVITDRALPDVRDGLKPVHRRILWAMKSLGLSHSGDYKKSARVVGETMGKYHPHGDSSIYDAMVHMAQDFCYLHPLVDGHGNFGSVEGDEAAASRYTEVRLSAITEEILLSDLDKEVVDFMPNFDNKEKEPVVLPATLPHILLSGTDGIAVGMSSKIPTHNLGEIVDAAVALLDKPKMKSEELFSYIQGPDFATGGVIVNKSELPAIYESGSGKIRIRAKVTVEKGEKGKKNIVVSEIPQPMIGAIDKFMDTVAELTRRKELPDVVDIKNLSGKDGIRIVIEVKRDTDAEQYINILYKKAKLEDTFGYNAMLLSGGMPYQMSLHRILSEYLDFYRETQIRKYKTLLAREKRTAEIKEGLVKAVDCIDTIIEVLRGSRTVQTAKSCLMKGVTEGIRFRTKAAEKIAKQFAFTELQADAILDMKLQKLIGLEMELLLKELEQSNKAIESYSALLSSKTRMTSHMRSELLSVKKKYAVPRRTEIVDAAPVEIKKPEIKEELVYAVVDRLGYIKLFDEATYNRNYRNIPKEYRWCLEVMNTGRLFVFTAEGKCHSVKAMSVPMGRFNEKGVPLEKVSALSLGEKVVSIASDRTLKRNLLLVSERGYVKKVALSDFVSQRKSVDIKLSEGDLLVKALVIEQKYAVLISRDRKAVSFDVNSLSTVKRTSLGVIGMKFDGDDHVEIAMLSGERFECDEVAYPLSATGKRGTKGKELPKGKPQE
ncbi:MAG: DNA topoisomerase 4 subunit A [Clostridia bacterium]|nr:DNA topoisomerase 4 subunit A [Clostridia bacterium]